MFVMIHENGDMILLKELTDDDLRAADEGVVDLLDVSTADAPLRYFDEGWTDVEVPNVALMGAEPASSAERPLEGTVMRKEEEC